MKTNENKNLLLVEDDENLGFILKDFLEMNGFEVRWEKDGEAGRKAFKSDFYGLCIFDVMLPKKDGFTLGKEIRQFDTQTPLIFLTAKSLKNDRISGLEIGADDYITKPFSTEELLLRIKAILRRTQPAPSQEKSDPEIFTIGKYTYNISTQLLTGPVSSKRLTRKEAEILKLLCRNIGTLVKREDALVQIWGEDDYFMGRSMDVYITKLRKYLSDDESVSIINVHGSGFMLDIK